MPDIASFTYLDHSGEKASVVFNIDTITALTLDDLHSDLSALRDAAAAITLGVLNKRIMTHKFAGSGTIPANTFAQRENKWLVGYTDVSTEVATGVSNPYFGKKFSVEVSTPDLANDNLQQNTDYADLTDTEVLAFKTAFEAYVRSPTGGAVEVSYIKYVGRAL